MEDAFYQSHKKGLLSVNYCLKSFCACSQPFVNVSDPRFFNSQHLLQKWFDFVAGDLKL